MRKASEIKELSLLSIQEGMSLEKVTRLIVNTQNRKVEYFTVEGTQWFESPLLLPFGKVKSIGKDLVAIGNRKDIVPVADSLKGALAKLVDITGVKVISACGQYSSSIADFSIDEATGDVKTLYLADGTVVDAATIITISAAAVITDSEAQAPAASSENDFLLGKTVAADIKDEKGNVVITAGTVITAGEIEAAKDADVLYDLVTGVK